MSKANNPTLGFLLADVTQLFRKHFDRRAAEFGLTRAQWKALRRIRDEPDLRQNDLAECLDLEPIAVGRVIDRLEKGGFVERRPDPRDRRCWRLHVTDAAHAPIDQAEGVAAELRREALRGISAGEQAQLVDLLTRLKKNLAAIDRPVETEA